VSGQAEAKVIELRGSSQHFWGWAIAAVAVLFLLSVAGYFGYLYVEVKQRFESRRWSIPSRVFSATVPIYPGQALSIAQMKQLLEERRYKEAFREPLQPGEYKPGRDSIVAYLREFRFPGRCLPAQRVEFTFQQNTLVKMKSGQNDLALLELEPLEIARLFGLDRKSRLLINIKQAPQYLVDGVLAIEDHRFYEHRGVDWFGMLRALYTDVLARRVVQGGSTITQQLVKNYFLEPDRTLKRKLQEVSMAVVLEALYSKDEILEMYLNEIYMGQRGTVAIHGMGEAALYYFGRNVEDLTLGECATLAGMLRGPNNYSPLISPAASIERRNVVLKRMLDVLMISVPEYEKARGEPLRVSGTNIPRDIAPYYVDYVRQQLHDLYDEKVLASEGLSINTVLHPEMVVAADTALREELLLLEQQLPDQENPLSSRETLQGVVIAVQPKTGAVLALAGRKNYAAGSLSQGLSTYRQAGSAIMPFVYLAALDHFTPVSWLKDEPASFTIDGENWTARNVNDRYRGPVMFVDALEQSLNAATVNLTIGVGVDKIIKVLHELGIQAPLPLFPSVAMGNFQVTPLELAGAYAVLDNDGQKPYLLSIKEVVTEKGEIQESRHIDFAPVTTPAKAYLITSILEGVVQNGAARIVKDLGVDFPCAAQIAASPDYRDSWFIGYTTDLLVVVWVGYDDNRSMSPRGSEGAARIWTRFVNQVRPWIHPEDFWVPPGIVQRMICTKSGELATPRCREQRLEVFLEGHIPKEYCTVHD
jgi:penicillin-binding protein 1B